MKTTDPTEEEIIEDIKRVNETVEGSVSINDMREKGEYRARSYQEKFGSWNEAKQAAGLDTTAPPRRRTRDELLEELTRLAEEYGPSVGVNDMRRDGKYSGTAYITEFGSWNEAKEAADLQTNDPAGTRWPDRDECIKQIRELGIELGRAPRIPDVRVGDTDYETKWYFDKFDGWGELLEEAGFDAEPPYNKIPKQVYLDDLQRVHDSLDRDYMKKDLYTEKGQFSGKTVNKQFGGWIAALEEAGLPAQEKRDRKYKYSEAELEDDLRRLSDELNKRPTAADLNEHGSHAYPTYANRYGSWVDALDAAGFDVEDLR